MNDKTLGTERNAFLGWLYEAYRECHPEEHAVIKADFEELYSAMNGMPLADMDRVIDPVCTLCRDHEREGFCEGVRVGVQLALDLGL